MVRISAVVVGLGLVFGAGQALACPGSAGKVAEKAEKATIGYVSVDEVAALHADGKTVFIDANKKETYEAGHIPGARHVRHDAVSVETLGADKNTKLVFYCANEQCKASHKAAKAAIELGYENVFVLKAGIDGWKTAGQKVAKVTADG